VLVGSAGCSARACHGGIEPLDQPVRRNEYTTWLTRDKHAEAYQVLLSDRSQRIEKNYRNLARLQDAHAEKDVTCLACHTNPLAAGTPDSPLLEQERAYGVGCEACHGPAQRWLSPHTAKGYRAEQKRADGMTALEDSAQLARRCAGCHVGAAPDEDPGMPLRDVNHDLIAAGHPRLNFEFAAFLANLPPHWNEKASKRRSEAQDWAVGQVVCARTALELLGYRADSRNEQWPEFAEYDCFACHHSLSEPSGRQKRGYGGRMPGSLPWSLWYYAMPKALAKHDRPQKLPALAKLQELMSQPYPDPSRVRRGAHDADRELQALLSELAKKKYTPDEVRHLLVTLAEEGQKQAGDHWDQDAQLYLGLAALDQAYRDETKRHDEQVSAAIRDLSRALAFPAASNNIRYDSPRDGDQSRENFRDALRKLLARRRQ
jgi:hypothetical protein